MLIPLYRCGNVVAYASVDAEDYARIAADIWHFEGRYAERRPRRSGDGSVPAMVRMHRAVACPSPGMQVDHINGDKLDNRKSNLRICTPGQNKMNIGIRRNNKSGFKGVYMQRGKYVAEIRAYGKKKRLGTFSSAMAAHDAYSQAALALHGEFARIQ